MLLVVAALALVSLVLGRLLVSALGADRLQPLDPAGAAASAIVGTATLTLVAVWLSEMKLPSPSVVKVVAALLVALAAVCWRRRRLDTLRVRGPARGWAALLIPALAAAFFALLPALRTNGYAIGNDTYTYCAYSEWLQGHGFGEECPYDPESPVTSIPRLYQLLRYDLGIAHLLGLVQAGTRSPSALIAYPPAAAWGIVLLVCSVVLVGRWTLRLSWPWAGLAAFLFAVVPHGVYWGHHNGSLQQTHALPVLLLGVALLTRAVSPRWWRPGTAVLLAIPVAFLIVVYLPMLPVLGAAAVVALAQGFAGARRRGAGRRGLAFVGTAGLVVVLFAFRDLVGVVERYVEFVTTAPGAHIGFGPLDFALFGAGTRVLAPGGKNVEVVPWSAVNRALTPAYLALALAGLAFAWRGGRTRGLAAAASLLLFALGYYALVARDPWTNEIGHTWSLFKLLQWAFPVIFLLEVLGLRRLAGRRRGLSRLVPIVAWSLPCTLLSVHWVWAARLGLTMREILPFERPLEELPALRQRIQGLPPGKLLVVERPANRHRWLAATTALLAYPRPIVGDWSASASMEGNQQMYRSLLRDIFQPGVVPLVAGFVPFQNGGVEDLGGGYARVLPSGRPLVVHVLNPTGLEEDERTGRPRFRLDEQRTKIVLFAPVETTAELVLALLPDRGGANARLLAFTAEGGYDHASVRRATEAPPSFSVLLEGQTVVRVPVRLGRGLTTAILRLDREDRSSSSPSWTVVGLGVAPAGSDTDPSSE